MPNRGQMWWKGHVKIIPTGVYQESISLPGKIVMVGNGWDAGFGDEFGNCSSKGDVHGYGERIFRNDQIYLIPSNKIIEGLFQFILDLLDSL